MDSKAINKLIRAEVWPILREQGFSQFDSRNAFAYKGPFVNVVNFQSFNSYLAGGLGCTTYSFAVNLGVYVIGEPGIDRVKHDKDGRLRPFEYQCSFRTVLKKRTSVDQFARDDIFFIDSDGRTTAACFQELEHQLVEFSPLWFNENNNLDGMLERMQCAEETNTSPLPDASGVPGSYNWNRLKSVLVLLKHQKEPSEQSALVALDSIGRVVETTLDFSTIQSGRRGEERYAIEVRALLDQLGSFKHVPNCNDQSINSCDCLDGPLWSANATHGEDLVPTTDLHATILAPRKQFWPQLKERGFSEFTERLAHRISEHMVEVVEFLPMDPMERKTWNLPAGLFRIGIGVFWPTLREEGLFRKNGRQESRPTVNECHISNWLAPEDSSSIKRTTVFRSIEDAADALTGQALEWLDLFRNENSGLLFLRRKDLELFRCYPMMRGYGASSSSRRLVYLAMFEFLAGRNSESVELILRAEAVLHARHPNHLWPRYENWIAEVKKRILRP